jgi:hypothetical protein
MATTGSPTYVPAALVPYPDVVSPDCDSDVPTRSPNTSGHWNRATVTSSKRFGRAGWVSGGVGSGHPQVHSNV